MCVNKSEIPESLPAVTLSTLTDRQVFMVGDEKSRYLYMSYKYLQQNRKNLCLTQAPVILENNWRSKPLVVQSMILHSMGKSKKIHARQCLVKEIDRLQAREFLESNHLMGYAGNGKSIALYFNDEVMAVASFSKARTMTDRVVYYKSYELVRFATLPFYHINGGLNKLIRYFIKTYHVQHLMTYTPLLWGEGLSLSRLGFHALGRTEPITIAIDPHTHSFIKEKNHLHSDLIEVTLPASKKWIWQSPDLP